MAQVKSVKNREGANALVAEVGRIDDIERSANDEYKKSVQKAKTVQTAKLYIDVDGKLTPLADYRDSLVRIVREYAEAHRQELFGKTQSCDLPAGSLKFQWGQPSVEFEDEKIALLNAELKCLAAVMEALDKIELVEGLKASTALAVSFRFNREDLKRGLKHGDVTPKHLELLKARLVPAVESFDVKPANPKLVAPRGAA